MRLKGLKSVFCQIKKVLTDKKHFGLAKPASTDQLQKKFDVRNKLTRSGIKPANSNLEVAALPPQHITLII